MLKAELSNCETGEDLRAFLLAAARENERLRLPQILVLVRASRAIFQVAPHRLVESLEALSGGSSRRIALVGYARDLHISHEYLELIARQRKLNVRSFVDEAAALAWLKERRILADRRVRGEQRKREAWGFDPERRLGRDRRSHVERRQRQRRPGT